MSSASLRARASWSIVALWAALAPLLLAADRAPSFRAGARTIVAITLVSQDAVDLGCASSFESDGYACARTAEDEPRARSQGVLVPCMTTERRLLLVPNLFEQPAVAARVALDLERGRPRENQQRFVVNCAIRVERSIRDVRVRWRRDGNLDAPANAWLVTPERCTVAGTTR